MKKLSIGLIVAAAFFGTILAAGLISVFVWYTNTVIPHTYATPYTNFWWGLVHGVMIMPTFFWSLFVGDVTIYQAPNAGNWYNVGYFIGISMVLGGSHGARSTKPKKAKQNTA